MSRVLVIDDEGNIRRMVAALLEAEGHEVHGAEGGTDGVRQVEALDPDVVLMDLVMPQGPDGLETLAAIAKSAPALPVIMMSGKATLADAVKATRLGAFQFLEKPLSAEAVLVTVKAALDLARARAEAGALRAERAERSEIVGSSAGIEKVRELIARVAPTAARVLITGESGTGKELVARAIHAGSPRRDRPVVCVNCAAVPRELVESELFGHERGAFTGATQRRRGKFEQADGGTLFLDEVGDLDSGAQAKLLRVLESGEFQRVGGERDLKVDVRVIAATNRDLEKESGAGRFRSDLFFRLNVFPVRVPALRDRLDDLPKLVQHFAALAARECGRPARRFGHDALERMGRHGWRGNVRELANVIERLTIVGAEGAVTAAELDAVLGSGLPPAAAQPDGGLAAALDTYEARLIHTALTEAKGSVAEAARRLHTDRANLYRRMKRLGLQNDTPVSE